HQGCDDTYGADALEAAHTRPAGPSRDRDMVLPFLLHIGARLAQRISSAEIICSFGQDLFWKDEEQVSASLAPSRRLAD
ncbi:MAG: hypothetical protein ACM3ON_05360, partial [Chloroflexota bacterium]